ncbi:cryptochrome/photolyase family protein [Pseudidiomarina sp. PP-1MA]|uniref:Cryptochrome/photolyase family protein n=1 Tax=Pseudidiomarina sp. PP-1MA TaxID=3237706 RepID=A0AB39X830_9GAMM
MIANLTYVLPMSTSNFNLPPQLTDWHPYKNSQITDLCLILGDQLNAKHSWFQQVQSQRLFVFMELAQEANYVTHHQQKILAFFAAMRSFAMALHQAGHQVLYLSLDAAVNSGNLTANLDQLITQLGITTVHLQQPDEYRLDQQLQQWATVQPSVSVTWCDTEHFICARDVLQQWFGDKPSYLMEAFYRRLRKQTGYLVDEHQQPFGGQWNYDKSNRNKLPAKHKIPAPLLFANDTSELADMLQRMGIKTMGSAQPDKLLWPVNRQQSLQLLDYFLEYLLPNFGLYQDAMTESSWAVYHARLSFSLNTKMLSPKLVIERAIDYWQQHQERISLAQIEGFVRQILGWREFVRAIYWQFMPNYKALNYFKHHRPLPDYFWTGDTKMRCLQHSLSQSLDYAYAHHIQRLMVIGNFSLLTELDPDAVDHWYLGVYIDAIEWVELPNTRGMSQFADGGIVASKPYVASGNYMNKMSSYCSNCHYQVKLKSGEKSCPLNSLYWHFIEQKQEHFASNPRMSLVIKQWQQRGPSERNDILATAQRYLEQLNSL